MTDRSEHQNGRGPRSRLETSLTRMGSWGALLALTGFLGYEVPSLCREFAALQIDEAKARDGTIMEWVDVHPNKSDASHPDPSIVGDVTGLRLWCGWSPIANQHQWFHVPAGQIDPLRLDLKFDRDTIRPIDRVLLESRGEHHWKTLPETAGIIGFGSGPVRRAYPAQLLSKVEVVHDVVDGRSILVVYTPFTEESQTYRIYDSLLDGKPLSIAVSGYFYDNHPLLFDRDTESFWQARDDRLESVSGVHRGKALAVVARPRPVRWDAWSAENPDGRLVVGAIRHAVDAPAGDLVRVR